MDVEMTVPGTRCIAITLTFTESAQNRMYLRACARWYWCQVKSFAAQIHQRARFMRWLPDPRFGRIVQIRLTPTLSAILLRFRILVANHRTRLVRRMNNGSIKIGKGLPMSRLN